MFLGHVFEPGYDDGGGVRVSDGGTSFRTPLADLPPGLELAVRLDT